jgi:hypothetical protein
MNPYLGNKEKIRRPKKKYANFSFTKSIQPMQRTARKVTINRLLVINNSTPRYKPSIPKVIPKGTQAFYFNIKGEFQNRRPYSGIYGMTDCPMKPEDVVFSCIAMNQNIAKSKFHNFYNANYKTSAEWYKLLPKEAGVTIHAATGWDQNNFEYAWEEEKITKEDFGIRLGGSDFHVEDVEVLMKW